MTGCHSDFGVPSNENDCAHSKAQKSLECTRGGVEDIRLEVKAKAKDTKKSEAKDSSSEDRPSGAKDRNARGQGQGPRTQAQVFSKKKVFKNFFSGVLQ